MKKMRSVVGLDVDTSKIKVRDGKEVGTWLTPLEAVLMQFTGLHDRNGKEIYEGDILSNSAYQKGDAVEVVKFKNGAFYCESGADAHLFYNVGYYNKEAQVIGNIYENAALLTL